MKTELQKALAKRTPFLSEDTTAVRLFCGEREGVPGLVIERYGKVAIFQVFEDRFPHSMNALREVAEWLVDEGVVSSVYAKPFLVDRSKSGEGKELKDPTPFAGRAAEDRIAILEKGLSLWIEPHGGFSSGLFLDQRENRAWLRDRAKGKRVLNLFSYTCAFSVACAVGGAAEVCSVDLSSRYLDWGRANIQLNRLDEKVHRFYARDVFDFLKRADKKEEHFDIVILDPPSFSRGGKGKAFAISRDWKELLERSAQRVAPGGILFFSSNYAQWQTFHRDVLSSLRDDFAERALPSVPFDFQAAETPLHAILLQRKSS